MNWWIPCFALWIISWLAKLCTKMGTDRKHIYLCEVTESPSTACITSIPADFSSGIPASVILFNCCEQSNFQVPLINGVILSSSHNTAEIKHTWEIYKWMHIFGPMPVVPIRSTLYNLRSLTKILRKCSIICCWIFHPIKKGSSSHIN